LKETSKARVAWRKKKKEKGDSKGKHGIEKKDKSSSFRGRLAVLRAQKRGI